MQSSNHRAVVFGGQGFSADQVPLFQQNSIYELVADNFKVVFGEDLPELSVLSEQQIRRNNISAAILLLSGLNKYNDFNDKETIGATAGYSVGQYLGLFIANVMQLEDMVRLVFERCRIMSEVASGEAASMVAILGMPESKIQELIVASQWQDKAFLANDNCTGNYSYAVAKEVLADFSASCESYGAYKSVALNTEGGWHSPFMEKAVEPFSKLLTQITLNSPTIPLVSNKDGGLLPPDTQSIKATLLEHLVCPVRWRDTILSFKESGIQEVLELTDFNLLSRMGPMISREMSHRSARDL